MMMYVYARRDDESLSFYPPLVAMNDKSAFSTYFSIYGFAGSSVHFYRIGLFNNETGAIEGTDAVDLASDLRSWMDSYSELARDFQKRVSEIGGAADGSESD